MREIVAAGPACKPAHPLLLLGVSTASALYAFRTQATASAGGTPARTAMHASTVPVRPVPPRQPISTSSPRRARMNASSILRAADPHLRVRRSPATRSGRRASSAATARRGRDRTTARHRRHDDPRSRIRARATRRETSPSCCARAGRCGTRRSATKPRACPRPGTRAPRGSARRRSAARRWRRCR